MELLSFLYLLLDFFFLIGSIIAFITMPFEYGFLFLLGFFLYPWIWEPFLMVFYRILFCCKQRPYADNFNDLSKRGCNLVYHPKYNMKLCGIEKRHPFDSCKYQRVINFLRDDHNYHLNPTHDSSLSADKSENSSLISASNSVCVFFQINS